MPDLPRARRLTKLGALPSPGGGLTPRQRRFVLALMGEARGNATKAAELAGYNGKTPESLRAIASKVKRHPAVRAAINAEFELLRAEEPPELTTAARLTKLSAREPFVTVTACARAIVEVIEGSDRRIVAEALRRVLKGITYVAPTERRQNESEQ